MLVQNSAAQVVHTTAIVQMTFNGVTKKLAVDLETPASVALNAALDLFSITENRHTMSLFTSTGSELADANTLASQGVHKDALLLLRPSTVKGGW